LQEAALSRPLVDDTERKKEPDEWSQTPWLRTNIAKWEVWLRFKEAQGKGAFFGEEEFSSFYNLGVATEALLTFTDGVTEVLFLGAEEERGRLCCDMGKRAGSARGG